MNTVFYLVRHGEKNDVKDNGHLTILGKKQAKHTALYLSHYPIQQIVTSPKVRTKQTAEIIGNILQVPITVESLLEERAEWRHEEYDLEHFLAIWKKASSHRHWSPPVGQSSYQAGKRMEKAVHNLCRGLDKHVIIVSHGGTISDFLRNTIPSSDLTLFKRYFDDVSILECSITIIEYKQEEEKFILRTVNFTDHLSKIDLSK